MPKTLSDALAACSPRVSPPPTPWVSILIQGGVMTLWVMLFLRAFTMHGVFAWSVGVVYVGYDTVLLGFVFWQTRHLARRSDPTVAPANSSMSLGVVVAAHNEAVVLPATLDALFGQSEPPDLVVIADDGSSDGTAAMLQERFGLERPAIDTMSGPSPTHPTLRWLRLSHAGKPAALNTATVLVDTELLLTVDGDTLLDPDAVAAMRRAFAADPHLVAATGILTPVCGATLSGRLFEWFQTFEYMRNFLSRYAWMQMDSLLLISGAFAGFRTAAVRAVGGFDPACLVEDYELIHRLRRYSVGHGLGWTTAVVGESRARTEAPGSMGAFLRQRRRWFGGFLQTQFWYRDMIGNGAYGRLGRFMLPVKSADTMQPLYGLTAFAFLIVYAMTGRLVLVGSIVSIMGAKLLVDIAFHQWSIHLYRRWAAPVRRPGFASGLLAALVEPFSFQLIRHLGAALGWVTFLTGGRQWGRPHRVGLAPSHDAAPRRIRTSESRNVQDPAC